MRISSRQVLCSAGVGSRPDLACRRLFVKVRLWRLINGRLSHTDKKTFWLCPPIQISRLFRIPNLPRMRDPAGCRRKLRSVLSGDFSGPMCSGLDFWMGTPVFISLPRPSTRPSSATPGFWSISSPKSPFRPCLNNESFSVRRRKP